MGIRKRERTFDNVVPPRKAEQKRIDPEISLDREDLESQLGGTVPPSFAARRLGVSRMALDKWIASGDVAVVITEEGRREIPILALLDLEERLAEQGRPGQGLHALESVLLEERRRVERLQPQVESCGFAGPHRVAETRALAYHRAIARRLRGSHVDQACRRLNRWKDEGKIDPRYARAWKQVLDLPIDGIREVLAADDERSRDLRQNSPFAGMLSEQERRKILAFVG